MSFSLPPERDPFLPAKAPSEPSSLDSRVRRELSPVLALLIQDAIAEAGSSEDRIEWPEILERVLSAHPLQLSRIERDMILSYLERHSDDFNILQELVEDPEVSDILVTNYSKIAIRRSGGTESVELGFASQAVYEQFVERLLLRAGSSCSVRKPIADGMIGGDARIHVVHRALCESGPYLTVRINRYPSVNLSALANAGFAPPELLAYLRGVVRIGKTVLIAGEVGTGKTTLVRALASEFHEREAILVIEDTPEIRLGHPNVRYLATRESNAEGVGRVSPAECIRAGMRMAMDRIIFGEMRDAEAAEAFVDVCASGHPGLSTIHARSAVDAVMRLMLFLRRAQSGVSDECVRDQVVTAVQVVVFVGFCPETRRRRVFQVREIGPVVDGVIRHRDIFQYDFQGRSAGARIEQNVAGAAHWRVLSRVSGFREALEREGIFLHLLPDGLELQAG